jgi:pimeloyl-ACP methyl ester carboxylesterase
MKNDLFRRGRRGRRGLFSCLLLLAGASFSNTIHADETVRPEAFRVGPDTYTRFTLSRDEAPPTSYYISSPRQKAPLVLYIQGSGCVPAFIDMGGRNYASTVFSLTTLAHAGQHAVMIVEKPNVPTARPNSERGALDCPKAFNDYFSMGTWLATVKHAVRHAMSLPTVDAKRVLVIGISEGATVASALARDMPEVSGVALVGATGPTQLYDFVAHIYRSSGDDAEKERQLRQLDETVARINRTPESSESFEWGHTNKRWSSFFKESSVNNLLQSRARIYLVSGMADNNVPILSTEVMAAQLRAQGRDVTFRRIPFAGHNLLKEKVPFNELQKEFDAVMAWFSEKQVVQSLP